jgi:hypothetical protein
LLEEALNWPSYSLESRLDTLNTQCIGCVWRHTLSWTALVGHGLECISEAWQPARVVLKLSSDTVASRAQPRMLGWQGKRFYIVELVGKQLEGYSIG